ncbi:MAG TPA: spondin domain-containing protein [Candidatus Limnocylindria bacterium]|nr:spondin domain-containing protein [Candidatus Limnocylindria bacterium]
MRSLIFPSSSAALLFVGLGPMGWAETAATPPIQITGAVVVGTDLRLTWAGGRPTYQLQTRPSLTSPWQILGQPTPATNATVSLDASHALFRVVADYTARFEVLFDATWSQQTHPGAWPVGAHWSGPVGAMHNSLVHFWAEGETASEGIRIMAELGGQSALLREFQAAIDQGQAGFTLAASGLSSPGQRVISFPQATTRDFPLLTLCSMIAPSPDWFAGVTGLSLLDADGAWIATQTVPLYGQDAGTDSGANFTSPDQVTNPRGVVTQMAGYPALVAGQIVPFGTFTIRRID